MRFLHNLIERRIFRFVVAYCAAAWAVLEVTDQVVGNGLLPAVAYRAVLTLGLAGLPGALIVSWFHGAKGRQEVPPIERWLLAVVAIFALATTGFVVTVQGGTGRSPVELSDTQNPARVAVLYFTARGGEDGEFLALGLTESLIDDLSRVEGLHVISRNGSQLFRERDATADEIGRELEVGSLVGGTVSVSGDRVRIDVALTSAVDGRQITSRRLERPRGEIFELQDELTLAVSAFLRRAIGTELDARILRASTSSAEAWELVQQGARATEQAVSLAAAGDMQPAARAMDEADALLHRAETADPEWTQPVVRRGWIAYRRSRMGGMDRMHNEEWIAHGISHAARAIALDPMDAGALELHATLVYWRYLLNLAGTAAEADRLFHEAERGFRASIARAPGGRQPSAHNSLSHLLINKGDVAAAKMHALKAYELDPFLENVHLTLWRAFTASWGLQDAVEAGRWCAEGARRFPDDFRFHQCQLMLPALPGTNTDITKAWAALEQFTAASPLPVREVNRRRGMMYVSMALVRAGLPDSAVAVVRAARADAEIDPLRELAHLESITWTWLGNADEAVRQLSLYLSANPQALEGLRADAERRELPWYHSRLADEPAFRSLVGLQ